MRKFLLALLIISICLQVQAQKNQTGAHAKHHESYWKQNFKTEKEYDSHYEIPQKHDNPLSRKCIVNKQIYGWHPAWSGSSYQQYDFALLNNVGYFSYQVDPKTGSYTTINQWRETDLVRNAHKFGAKVELTATIFGGKEAQQFLSNENASATFRDSVLTLLKFQDADGICIDFEGMGSSSRKLFVAFIDSLEKDLHAWKKDASITIALYAIDWENAFDIPALVPLADRFILMGYDYHYSGSNIAGPVAPLSPSEKWGKYSVQSSIESYLKKGMPEEKLLLGVPYYGYRWKTKSKQPKSESKQHGEAVLLREYIQSDSAAMFEWDSASTSGWLPGKVEGEFQQLWIDQHNSLEAKYQLVNQMGLAGIGIWALGYDQGTTKYWDLIKSNFADCNAGNRDQLNADYQAPMPTLEGETSAERNTWNWVWMLGGGIISVLIMWLAKKYL